MDKKIVLLCVWSISGLIAPISYFQKPKASPAISIKSKSSDEIILASITTSTEAMAKSIRIIDKNICGFTGHNIVLIANVTPPQFENDIEWSIESDNGVIKQYGQICSVSFKSPGAKKIKVHIRAAPAVYDVAIATICNYKSPDVESTSQSDFLERNLNLAKSLNSHSLVINSAEKGIDNFFRTQIGKTDSDVFASNTADFAEYQAIATQRQFTAIDAEKLFNKSVNLIYKHIVNKLQDKVIKPISNTNNGGVKKSSDSWYEHIKIEPRLLRININNNSDLTGDLPADTKSKVTNLLGGIKNRDFVTNPTLVITTDYGNIQPFINMSYSTEILNQTVYPGQLQLFLGFQGHF